MADFTVGSGASANLQEFIKAIEPYGIKTPQGSALRKSGFSKADSNGTGMASLAEVENFIKAALEETYAEDEERAGDLFRLYRPCFIRAFSLAKNISKGNGKVLAGAKTATSDDYISFSEFRIFCVYLTIYAAMYDIFTLVDGENAGVTEEDDSRINLEEFLDRWESLGGYGFKALDAIDSVDRATEIFNVIDTNNGGFILFKEWSDYIKDKEIQAKTHIGTLLSGNLTATKISPDKSKVSSRPTNDVKKATPAQRTPKPIERPKSRVSTATSRSAATTTRTPKNNLGVTNVAPTTNIKTQMKLSPTIDGTYKPTNASKELKEFIRSFQPYAEKNDEAKRLRKMGFKKCDSNGTGECSLAEIDGFILTNLKDDHGPKLGEKLFKLFRPSYIVAYNGAKNLKANAKGNDDDYINFAEFRVLNVYLCIYAGMLDAFSTIDGGGSGVTEDDDRRMDKNEWLKGYIHVRTSGFIGLGKLVDKDAALAAFEAMDANDSGKVLFRDFCDYLSAAEVDAGTKMGILFSGNGLQISSFNKEVEEQEPASVGMSEQDDIDLTFAERKGHDEANMNDAVAADDHQEAEIETVENKVEEDEVVENEVDEDDATEEDAVKNEVVDVVEDNVVENELVEVHDANDEASKDDNHDEHGDVVVEESMKEQVDTANDDEEENPTDDPEKNVLANGSLNEDALEVDAAQ
jgi:hypothetical protein